MIMEYHSGSQESQGILLIDSFKYSSRRYVLKLSSTH